MSISPNLPGSEVTVVTYIGEKLDIDAMQEAARFVIKREYSIKETCTMLNECGVTAVREQFGDGIDLARADFYAVQCANEHCPNLSDEEVSPGS